jgi:hypothetical protein
MDFLYGECESLSDAIDFIHFKRFDGWRIMCPPFKALSGQGWDFLLYKL